jgi:D-glycero-D-manno-heptose 1,7-bisphosphate phosphatase
VLSLKLKILLQGKTSVLANLKLVILDRDGVINEDSDAYIKSPDEFHPIPGSLEAIAAMNRAGYIVAIATNQSGVGRGYYSLEVLEAIHDKLTMLLAREGGHIDTIVFCPHTPEDDCACRKPKPGLIKQILSIYPTIKPSEVLVIGDSFRDLEAAWAEHCHAVLVRTGKGVDTHTKHRLSLEDVPVYDDLAMVVEEILL